MASTAMEAKVDGEWLKVTLKFCFDQDPQKLEYLSRLIASGSGPAGITRRAPDQAVQTSGSAQGFSQARGGEVGQMKVLPMTRRAEDASACPDARNSTCLTIASPRRYRRCFGAAAGIHPVERGGIGQAVNGATPRLPVYRCHYAQMRPLIVPAAADMNVNPCQDV